MKQDMISDANVQEREKIIKVVFVIQKYFGISDVKLRYIFQEEDFGQSQLFYVSQYVLGRLENQFFLEVFFQILLEMLQKEQLGALSPSTSAVSLHGEERIRERVLITKTYLYTGSKKKELSATQTQRDRVKVGSRRDASFMRCISKQA